MRVLDLFSGIGGFSLGLERTGGFRTVAFCEIEPFPRRVLAKHWPEVPCYDDVQTLTAARLRGDGITVDAICGGFPCQDISLAGAGAGIGGARSGLWAEYARLIGELRPSYVIVENVAALLVRGIDRVLGDLAALGYDAEWDCVSAAHVGAPHRRDRTWIVAYPECRGLQGRILQRAKSYASEFAAIHRDRHGRQFGEAWWPEPKVGLLADGLPNDMDELRCLGNAVVPQIPELIGRAILTAEAQRQQAVA